MPKPKFFKTHIPGLDDILCGGIPFLEGEIFPKKKEKKEMGVEK